MKQLGNLTDIIPIDIMHKNRAPSEVMKLDVTELRKNISGDVFTDREMLILYATDASAYREVPLAVIRPKNKADLKAIILFARINRISIIPRTAGTSLAGQVVGKGIVVDVSKYMTRILELNVKEKWVKVEPGVVLDELNRFLEPQGLFFAPETSTSNRCMMGGMVGNNSCGAHSILYGSTRDHIIAVRSLLSDGSEVLFRPLTKKEFAQKCKGEALENKIYRKTNDILSDPGNQKIIKNEFPHPSLNRRNNGYALDLLLRNEVYGEEPEAFNMCKILAGSEGTLAFSTELTFNLLPLPPKVKALVCIHFKALEDSFEGNLIALKYKPGAVEMMDHIILELTHDNIEQQKNRFFVHGNPAAMLIVEFARDTREEIEAIAQKMEAEMRASNLGTHFPVVWGNDIDKVWNLRKAGLGILSNMKGDAKPVPVIEDTAVRVEDLPAYMKEFKSLLDKHGKTCVYYAHIGGGEIHLRPILNLKDPKDIELFHTIAEETAHLVKKYNGSMSGEHGDGRLRGEFIPIIVGNKNYRFIKEIKEVWDPMGIFNAGKIVDTPRMNTHLRYEPGQFVQEIETIFDFSSTGGFLQAAEQCTGSGDCRKSALIGGTMCPSFMATRDERNTTRARANLLRELFTHPKNENPFKQKELYDILDLCLSCKGCKSECPSNVDMTKLKAEFLQHYYDSEGIPLRTRLVAYISRINQLGSLLPGVFNRFVSNPFFSKLLKKMIGFAKERSIPHIGKTTLRKWARKYIPENIPMGIDQTKVYFFIDEFTNYNDVEVGKKAIQLLTRLGYHIVLPRHVISGRTFLSKGLLRSARKIAIRNVSLLENKVDSTTPLIGIEPSAILSFRDEYSELVGPEFKKKAEKLAGHTFMIDEFLAAEIKKGNISKDLFTTDAKTIMLHGHCQQKSIASTDPTKLILSFPENYTVEEIPSGCCGMAGSFGYEKEHYELSMKIGELILFPEIRKTSTDILIAAPGTSCRHQIKDGTEREAKHPVEILYEALK